MCFPGLIEGITAAGAAIGKAASGVGFSNIMQVVGAATSAAGALAGAQAQAAGANAQAAFNERQSQMETEAGAYESSRERERAQRLLARQRAGFLASGVALEGTPTAVIEDTAAETAMDIAAIRWGSHVRAGNFQMQARMDRANARNAAAAGPINAAGALAGGLTRLQSPYRIS